MKGIIRRTAAALMACAVIGSTFPAVYGGILPADTAITAEAASTVSFDKNTGVLTLKKGLVDAVHVLEYRNNPDVIKVVAEEGAYLPKDCSNLFNSMGETFSYEQVYWLNLRSIDLTKADTSLVNNMSHMFYYCKKLKYIDVSNFNMERVTDMSFMFGECDSLTTVDLSGLNTKAVTNMDGLFCMSGVQIVFMNNMDLRNVKNMHGLFHSCSALEYVEMNGIDTSSVTDFSSMFNSCYNLTSVPTEVLDTRNAEALGGMFFECRSLTALDLSNFRTSKVRNMNSMFAGCSNLETLDISSFDTGSLKEYEDAGCMFYECSKLRTIYGGDKWDLSNLSGTTSAFFAMFNGCYNLVGGCGTVCDGAFIGDDYKYASFDTPAYKGYFTRKPLARFTTNSMTLGGSLGLNFFADLNDCPESARKNAYVDFTVNGKKQKAYFNADRMNSAKTAYGFTCLINVVSMADPVEAVLHYTDKYGIPQTVKTISTAENYLKKFGPDDKKETWELIKAINDLGYHMQIYLSEHSSKPWTLGVDHKAMEKAYNPDICPPEQRLVYLGELEPYMKEKHIAVSLRNINYSLVLDSDTLINFKIQPRYSDTSTMKVYIDDKKVDSLKKLEDGRYQVTVRGISAHQLGTPHTITVDFKKGVSTMSASALSYVYECINAPKYASELYAMAALYEYYKATIAYKNSKA